MKIFRVSTYLGDQLINEIVLNCNENNLRWLDSMQQERKRSYNPHVWMKVETFLLESSEEFRPIDPDLAMDEINELACQIIKGVGE